MLFTARRYAYISSIFAVCRCLSVCLSVRHVCYVVKLLSWPVSSIIVVFKTPSPGTQFQGKPLQGALNTWGGKKLRFTSETI